MSNRFVRSSKFRHVFGTANKRELCYDNIKVTRSAWDSNKVAVNGTYMGIIWEAGGGGSVCVLPNEQTGKQKTGVPLISGHKAPVLDMAFNPFDDSILATSSEDAYVKIWQIPEGGLTETMTTPVQQLRGHRRKVGSIAFHPVASNVLATSSTDYFVKLWDIESGEAKTDVSGHTDIIQSMCFNHNGSRLVTTCKDKKIRITDTHSGEVVQEWSGHQGVKGSRCVWLGERDQIFTVGFSKMSERQFSVWDARNTEKALAQQNIDTSSGVLMPFYDADTTVLFLAGKGDGNIRYYEMTGDDKQFYLLSEYKSATPQRGMCMLPKVNVDVGKCEIARLYKVQQNMIEPISFKVPRKSDLFQDDIFPDTNAPEPAQTAAEFFGGATAEPKKVSMEEGYVKPEKTASFKPVMKEEPKELTQKELKEEHTALTKRVAYLEAELVKRDARIKELEAAN